jgi:predicted XRE-type DNA-binding protein
MLSKKQLTQLRASRLEGANKLKQAIAIAGVTQVQVAEGIGSTQPHVSEIANGNYSRLPFDTVVSLAQYFGCASEDLFPSKVAVG